MFGPEILGALLGAGMGLLIAILQCVAQMQSSKRQFEWKEPLLFSIIIATVTALVFAVGGLLNGEGTGTLPETAAFFLPILIAVSIGAVLGRLVGWALQRLFESI